ncbi:hypothetical protein PspLS_02500 [Pyricularia sp. CBS 133598]|nr:hypothetical protein PspLS_02500 [Pyricularia sp. CBS 133598]
MGVAFETRVCASGEEGDAGYIEQRMAQCQDRIGSTRGILRYYTSMDVRALAKLWNTSFYHVDDNMRRGSNGEVVLYYTFRRSDVQKENAIKHMLATFLAQLICHFPTLSEFIHAQFERLLQDRWWNDYDLLN